MQFVSGKSAGRRSTVTPRWRLVLASLQKTETVDKDNALKPEIGRWKIDPMVLALTVATTGYSLGWTGGLEVQSDHSYPRFICGKKNKPRDCAPASNLSRAGR